MSASMELSGFDDMVARLQKLDKKGASIQNDALRAGAEPLADAMRENVNVSGRHEVHVRDDIQISRVKVSQLGVRSIDIGPSEKTAWRAKFLEFGTTKMPAYPFVQPAIDEKKKDAFQRMADVMREGLAP